jgi:hypothetical protein
MADQEALGLELAKRVADRDATDAVLLGEPLLGEARSGSEATGEDVVPQAGGDLLGQGSRLQRLHFGSDVVYGTPYATGRPVTGRRSQ